jgi:hypothetical protein
MQERGREHAHDADLMLGFHVAGLICSWWLWR